MTLESTLCLLGFAIACISFGYMLGKDLNAQETAPSLTNEGGYFD